jgi:hypothetical protein
MGTAGTTTFCMYTLYIFWSSCWDGPPLPRYQIIRSWNPSLAQGRCCVSWFRFHGSVTINGNGTGRHRCTELMSQRVGFSVQRPPHLTRSPPPPWYRDAAPSHTFPDRTAFPLLRARPRGHGQSLRARAARGTTPRALVLSWGAGFYGQTGLGANLDVYEPQEVGVLGQGFRVLAVGYWI